MEDNGFNTTSLSNLQENQPSRHSQRTKKPIKIYQPEFGQVKQKKSEYAVQCKILKSKGLSFKAKGFEFTTSSNLPAISVLRKFIKKTGMEQFQAVFAYFCEESKSKL